MLIHRTEDPAERAWHVARREAERVLRETGSIETWVETQLQTFRETLIELVDPVVEVEIEESACTLLT